MSYVLAGSEAHIIQRMLDRGRAFYRLADHLHFGSMAPDHLARWIDDRMTQAGVAARGVGTAIVAKAAPRTRDIVQVARQCFDNCRGSGTATLNDVAIAFDDVVAEQEALFQATWNRLTPLKQNVLRAVSADLEGLTTSASLLQFGLRSSGGATTAAQKLIAEGHLLRSGTRTGYGFENPFFGGWVAREPLRDLGPAGPGRPPDQEPRGHPR